MKPKIKKIRNTGDYDRYLISYKGDHLIQSYTAKWGDKIDKIHSTALDMKTNLDL